MIVFKIDDCKDKLSKLSKDDSLKLVYGWIIQNHITLKQFQDLISFINNEKTSDKNYYDDLEEWNNSFHCNECGCDCKADFVYYRTVANGDVWICIYCNSEILVDNKPNEY